MNFSKKYVNAAPAKNKTTPTIIEVVLYTGFSILQRIAKGEAATSPKIPQYVYDSKFLNKNESNLEIKTTPRRHPIANGAIIKTQFKIPLPFISLRAVINELIVPITPE